MQTTRQARPTGKLAGFSLVEMMVVLVVMSIMLAVGMPNFLSIGRRDSVEGAAYDMQRTLSLARQKALAKRLQHRVVVDPSQRTYFVQRFEAGVWVFDSADTLSWHPEVELTMVAGGQATNFDIVIEQQGTLEVTDAPAALTFWNAHGDSTRVSFVRTGRLRVL